METEIKNISLENNVQQFERFVDPELKDEPLERNKTEERFDIQINVTGNEQVKSSEESVSLDVEAPSLLPKELGEIPLIDGYDIDETMGWKFNLESERFEAGVFLGSDFIIDTLSAFGRYEAKFFDPVKNQDKVGIYEMNSSGRIRLTIAKKDRVSGDGKNKFSLGSMKVKGSEVRNGVLGEAFDNYNVVDFFTEKNRAEQKKDTKAIKPLESEYGSNLLKRTTTNSQALPTSLNEAVTMRLPEDPILVTVPIAENANGIVLLKVA